MSAATFTAACPCGRDATWRTTDTGTPAVIDCTRCDSWTIPAQVSRWRAMATLLRDAIR